MPHTLFAALLALALALGAVASHGTLPATGTHSVGALDVNGNGGVGNPPPTPPPCNNPAICGFSGGGPVGG